MSFILSTVSSLHFLSPSFAGTTYLFTNANATGFNGPTQAQIDTAYAGSTLQGLVTISTRGIQTWTVPTSGEYSITIAGAAGGSNLARSLSGGGGALLTTVVSLTAGTVLNIVVGQKGTDSYSQCSDTFCGASGGGGSFVYTSTGNTFLAVAGGGGGAAANTTNLFSSKTTADGKALVTSGTSVGPTASPCTPNLSSTGGTNGSGGSLSNRTSNTNTGAPGAGINSAGATYANAEGKSLSGNWLGGNSTYTSNLPGGFGGGAAATSTSTWFWSGGGGGYSGGGAGFNAGCGDAQYGGGGGSYYTGNLTSSSNGANSSHGYVTITQQTVITANFNSFALVGNATTATFRTVITITASVDISARVTFKEGNSVITGCKNKIATGSGSVFTTSCTWKPSRRGSVSLSAIATPVTGGDTGSAIPIKVFVANRTGPR